MSTLKVDKLIPYSGNSITIDAANIILTGSFATASYAITAASSSYSVTASYAINGGTTPTTPVASDYITISSYSGWVLGANYGGWFNFNAGTNTAATKFDSLSSWDGHETPGANFLKLELIGGQVNGVSISTAHSQSVYVTASNVTYRNDSFGLAPVNYIDFINSAFHNLGINTKITGSSVGSNRVYARWAQTDNFSLTFKETGFISGSSGANQLNPVYYFLTVSPGQYVADSYSGDLPGTNLFSAGGSGFKYWGLYSPAGA